MNKFWALIFLPFFVSYSDSLDSEAPYRAPGPFTRSYQQSSTTYDDHLGRSDFFSTQHLVLLTMINHLVNEPIKSDPIQTKPSKKNPKYTKKQMGVPTRLKHEHPHPKSTYCKR